MCGIYGFFSNNKNLDHQKILKEGIFTLLKRGPDSNGTWFNKSDGIGFSHSRLSIQDLSNKGHQPMCSSSGRFVLSFNGEIYNHQEIRQKFKDLNFNIEFRSSSDSETLLESIEIFGLEKTLKIIQGMFAFSLWDKKKKKLIIARDRLGEKPLYYCWINNSFVFASEIKALKTFPNFKKDINFDALDNYLKYGYVPIGSCIFSNVKKLEPGCFLSISSDDFKEKVKTFWSITEVFINSKMNPFTGNIEDAEEEFTKLFDKTIQSQLISDAPIGAFLSGGIDSTYVVSSMARQCNNKIKTFSIGFEDQKYNEAKYARRIANFIGTDHSEFYLNNNDLIKQFLLSPNIYDEPFADSSQLPTLCLSQFAAKKVKVILTGDGADEIFGGYNRYKYHNLFKLFTQFKSRFLSSYFSNLDPEILYKNYLRIPSIFRKKFFKSIESQNSFNKIKKISALISASDSKEYYQNILSFDYQNAILKNKENLIHNSVIDQEWENINFTNDLEKMMLIDQKFYLSDNILFKVDRACMSNSLENRTPFIDHKILDFIWRLPLDFKLKGKDTKYLLKKCIHKNIPKNIFNNTKMGFTFPINDFLDGPLYEITNDFLSFSNIKRKGIFEPKEIEKIKLDHKAKRKDNSELIWKLINFQNWAKANDI